MCASTWSDDRIEHLKSLWQAGQSATEVALGLGGVTRNAVLGKLHRLGLLNAGDGRASRPRSAAPRKPAIRPSKTLLPVTIPEPNAFTFEDGSFATLASVNDRMCRWPIGDPKAGDFHFCGHAPQAGSCYCEAHNRRAHRPSSVKARQSAEIAVGVGRRPTPTNACVREAARTILGHGLGVLTS